MMHNVSIAIILSTVIEQYSTEARFYETQLGIDREQWEAWKNGTASLTPAENQKIKLLFSDYEWMLIQKIVRFNKLIGAIKIMNGCFISPRLFFDCDIALSLIHI